MNRNFASQLVFSIGQNMMSLVRRNIPYYNTSIDAMWLAMTKLKMTIHARFLSQLLQDLFNEDNPIMMAEDSAEKMQQLYNQIWNNCYDYEIPLHRYKFSQFWDGLVEFKKIAIEDLPKYEDAKVQIFILWRTVGNLFYSGEERYYDDYNIKQDSEFISGAINQGCSHTHLDRVISLIYSLDYIPVHPDWKDSSVPAILKPFCNPQELSKKKPDIHRTQYGNRTLGDIWEDYSTLQFVDKSIPKYMVLLRDVDNELAQALGELSNTYVNVIKVLGDDKDLNGRPWDSQTPIDPNLLAAIEETMQKVLSKRFGTSEQTEKDPWANYDYTVWETIALENKLLKRDLSQVGIYNIAVRSMNGFLTGLEKGVRAYAANHSKNDEEATSLYFQFFPTYNQLSEKIRKANGQKYGKRSFESIKNSAYH